MNIRKLTDTVTYFGGAIFSFYVVGGRQAALIELGISQTAPVVARVLREELLVEPAWLVAPHSHFDHAGGAVRLMQEFPGAALAGGEETARALADPDNVETYRGAMELVNGNPLFRKAFPHADGVVDWRPVRVGRVLRNGDSIDTGGGALEVMSAPGHSPCGICLFHRETGALFVSDACGMPLPSGRIWPTAFDNLGLYLDSMRSMLALEPEFVCPGHFVFFRGARARRYLEKAIAATENFFERLEKMIGRFGPDEQLLLSELKKDYDEDVVFIQDNILRHGNRAMVRQALEKHRE
jgi:2-aminobenzoylacetyl-CoA thioesterase